MLPLLPEQRVSEKKKNEPAWQKQCIEALVGRATSSITGNRSSRLNKQINYDLFNSIINLDDFTHITAPYGQAVHEKLGNMPANFQDYNIVRSSVLTLMGEESFRPFNWKVIATGGEGYNQYINEKKEALEYSYLSLLRNSLGEKVEQTDPAKIDEYFKNSYTSNIEIVANKILKHLQYSLRLENLFLRGFMHSLISAEEIFLADIIQNEPTLIPLNPINFECDKSSDTEFIEDGDWGVYRIWLDRGQVLDWFGDRMDNKAKEELRSDNVFNSNATYGQSPGVIPTTIYNNNWANNVTKILVSICAWRSEKKIGFLEYIDPKGLLVKTVVDEDFNEDILLQSGIEYNLRWEWVPRCWIGVQIGPNIFFAYEREYQDNTLDNPYKCKLPFIGKVFNAVNSYPTSLVELIKPFQYIYNVTWYRLETELARSKGKKFVMDIAQLPKSKGWTVEEWSYYFETLGVAWINSMEEGREGDSNTVSKFNQFTSIDMTMSNAIQGYFTTLSKIEERVEEITGITRQRKGNINNSETVGGVERAVRQSTAITEIFHIEHNMVKERVLEALLEIAKICYSRNEKGKMVFDEFSREVLETNVILNTDFGLYVTNSPKEHNTLESLKALAKEGISSGQLAYSSLVTLLKSNSIAEVETAINKNEQIAQNNKQQELNNQQEQIASTERIAKEKMENENEQNELDRQNKITIATINATRTMQGPSDANMNNIPDNLEVMKFGLEQSKENFNQMKETNKFNLEKAKLETELQLQANENAQQNKQHQDKMLLEKEKLALAKEKNDIARKSLKYKKQPTTKK